ncbi:MAG: hypothetical protein WDZ41_03790 [Candidatus Babeliales bacterium]
MKKSILLSFLLFNFSLSAMDEENQLTPYQQTPNQSFVNLQKFNNFLISGQTAQIKIKIIQALPEQFIVKINEHKLNAEQSNEFRSLLLKLTCDHNIQFTEEHAKKEQMETNMLDFSSIANFINERTYNKIEEKVLKKVQDNPDQFPQLTLTFKEQLLNQKELTKELKETVFSEYHNEFTQRIKNKEPFFKRHFKKTLFITAILCIYFQPFIKKSLMNISTFLLDYLQLNLLHPIHAYWLKK